MAARADPVSNPPPTQRGRFITFEGGEGAGKSTQIRLLADSLTRAGVDCLLTREPGGSEGAEAIRTLLVTGAAGRWDPVAEVLLFAAARADHAARVIRPALAAGRWVLCDRFADSTLVYQGYGRGLDRQIIDDLRRLSLGDLEPDLTLVLDVPVEVGLVRAVTRAGTETRFESMDLGFHQRVRYGFLALARNEPRRCAVIEAHGDVETVAAAIRDRVALRFNQPLT